MSDYFKRLLFRIYVFCVHRKKKEVVEEKFRPPTFIWKHSWFFFWHRFFWTVGRWALSHFMYVKPLLDDGLTPEAEAHYHRFMELAGRDYSKMSLTGKVMQPTRYTLAEDTAAELCLFYACIADGAPWQYGVEARKRASRIMRDLFLASVVGFIVLCNVYVSGSSFYAWTGYWLFMAIMVFGAGWYADSAMLSMAKEGERLRSLKKPKHPD